VDAPLRVDTDEVEEFHSLASLRVLRVPRLVPSYYGERENEYSRITCRYAL
jgi:hypothetical protein